MQQDTETETRKTVFDRGSRSDRPTALPRPHALDSAAAANLTPRTADDVTIKANYYGHQSELTISGVWIVCSH